MLAGQLQYVALPQYCANLKSIIVRLGSLGRCCTPPRIILVTPAPIYEAQAADTDRKKGFQMMRRTENNTAVYAQGVRDVGKELHIPVLDLWKLMDEDARQYSSEGGRDHNERFNKYFSDGESRDVFVIRSSYQMEGRISVVLWPMQC